MNQNQESCTHTRAYPIKPPSAHLGAYNYVPPCPPIIRCTTVNPRNGTIFGGVISEPFWELPVAMHAGATMIPELGFWHSAPESVYMAQCPNQGACMGDRLSLQACQTAAYAAPTLNGTTQVCSAPASA